MSWPVNKDVKTKIRAREEFYDTLGDISEQIQENFNGVCGSSNDFIHIVFTNYLKINYGLDFVFKLSCCESCEHYIGVSSFARFFKKILILNGCCNYFSKAVKPQGICPTWNPKPFWRRLICYKVEKYCADEKNNYPLQQYFQDVRNETGMEYAGVEYENEYDQDY
jgi:hypothetical protein